jgi:hypothetical protein
MLQRVHFQEHVLKEPKPSGLKVRIWEELEEYDLHK